ncbi:MAG: tRNA epoxyqueuosine(34) reductase QueG [Phycisphaerales bacterium]|nr:tRNA epoxyqueuosine(34) reductase QueG [Phycisphaerales bacterium]
MPQRASNPTAMHGPRAGLDGAALSRWIIDTCTRSDADGGLGFTAAGVCAADAPPAEDVAVLDKWLKTDRGTMDYMSAQAAERIDPTQVLSNVQSVVMVADRYASRDGGIDATAEADRADGLLRGRVARYARGRDYHATIKRRVHRLADSLRAAFPTEAFRTFVDTAPVLERRFAQRAGIGWLAKNAMLIHPVHGSYLLLGGLFTTLRLPEPPQSEQPTHTDHCGTCTRCIDACPTSAIAAQPLAGAPGSRPRIDGSRCISYLTIEHEGVIDPALAERTGDWVFGCDVCQEVCPHNSPRPGQPDASVRDEYTPQRATLPILQMADWKSADRSLLTVSSMKRATAEMFRRNAALALASSYRQTRDPAALQRLRGMLNDECAVVAQTAAMAVASLG